MHVHLLDVHSLLLGFSEIFVCLFVHVVCDIFKASATSRQNSGPKKIVLDLRIDIPREARTGPHRTHIVISTIISQ